MALIVPGHVVSELRGSVGSVTATGVRGGLSLQSRAGGRVRSSNVSVGLRSGFSETSRRWRDLAAADRLAWDRVAGGAGRGQGLFMSVVFRRFKYSGAWDFELPVVGVVGGPGAVTLSASATGPAFVISWSTSSATADGVLIGKIGFFPSPATAAPIGGWAGWYPFAAAQDGTVDLGSFLGARVALFQAGRAMGVRVAFWRGDVGKMSGEHSGRCIVAV